MTIAVRTRAYGSLGVDFVDIRAHTPGRDARMAHAADALWEALAPTGVSWIGFYLFEPGCVVEGSGDRADGMVLGARRDKPACSPIGMHGACGRSYLGIESLVVRDVASLGAGYIACDPRDRSEVVVPLRDGHGPWGVLDADSFEVGAFDAEDARSLGSLMGTLGLDVGEAAPIRLI